MRVRLAVCLSVLLVFITAACAIADSPGAPTQIPPLTFNPPPTLTFGGNCNYTPDLEHYVQDHYFLITWFRETLNNAALLSPTDMRPEVLRMAGLRDQMSTYSAPDCATELHQLTVDTMTRAVATFQAYSNGDAADLGNIVVDTNGNLDIALDINLQLQQRLDIQALTVTPPSP
jgi:hypothetical protein